jgi:hypothetical protein
MVSGPPPGIMKPSPQSASTAAIREGGHRTAAAASSPGAAARRCGPPATSPGLAKLSGAPGVETPSLFNHPFAAVTRPDPPIDMAQSWLRDLAKALQAA